MPKAEDPNPKKFVWYDAQTETRADKEMVMNTPTKELLARCVTYGVKFKEDDDGVVIVTEFAGDDEVDYVVIPKKWISK